MSTRGGSMWRPFGAGSLVHNPMNAPWGPKSACPGQVVVVPPTGMQRPWSGRFSVTLSLLGPDAEVTGAMNLNPGAARWLGNRLIEAAVLAETQQEAGEDGRAQLAALAAHDQDGETK